MLSVGLVVSGAHWLPTSSSSKTSVAAQQIATENTAAMAEARTNSTGTDTLVLSFRHSPPDPAAAALLAVKAAASSLAGAKVVRTKTLRRDAAWVKLDKKLSRAQASRLAAAVRKQTGIKYAEASVTFSPTDTGTSSDSYFWNLAAVNASGAWTSTTGEGVVVGVIDTGVADNPYLPKALLVTTSNEEVSGAGISGTTWPGRPVTIAYTADDGTTQTASVTADSATGDWSMTLDPTAKDASTATLSVTDASENPTTTTVTVDAATTVTVNASSGKTISGTAEAGDTITLTYPDKTSHSTTATADGTWSVTPAVTLADGDIVTITAADDLDNTATTTLTIDASTSVTVAASNGSVLEGTAEAGDTLAISYIDGDGTDRTATATATGTGSWSTTLDPAAGHGTKITVVATDTVGNSASADVTVDAATAVTINPSNGEDISGTAEAGDTIDIGYVTASGTDKSAAATTASDGTWSASLDPAAQDSSTITVTATDSLKNTASATVRVDASTTVTVEATNGETLAGTAEAGDTVAIGYTDASATSRTASTTAAADGTWSLTLSPVAEDDTTVTVKATDALGNSATKKVTVDASTTVTVKATNGTTIRGTAEAGDTITLTYPDESTQNTTADADGTWSVTPTATLTDGDIVAIAATDSLKNTATTSVTIDLVAATVSVASPTNGTTLSGTTETGATLTISYWDSDGTKHTRTVTEAEAAWALTLSPAAKDGSEISVTATDDVGNVSAAVTASVDSTAPSAPTVQPSNGKVVMVTGVENDATISIVQTGTSTEVAGDWTHSGDAWRFVPTTTLTESDHVSVIVADTAGNSCDPVSVTIDTTKPEPPTITTATTTILAGTAEAGATIAVSYHDDSDTEVSLSTLADSGGAWSLDLAPTALPGSVVSATASDAAGNTSAATTATIPEAEPTPTPSPSPSDNSSDDSTAGGTVSSESVSSAGTAKIQTVSTTAAELDKSAVGGTVLPGYDFFSGDTDATDPESTDADGDSISSHGTHVAGTVAAQRVAPLSGVAPGVQILPIRVLGNRSGKITGDLADIDNAILWGAGESVAGVPDNPYPADVLNLSIKATTTSCPADLQSAINTAVGKGTTVVVAAGNDNASISTQSPANCSNVIVVTATTYKSGRAAYSNWGDSGTTSAWLVAAPGGSGSLTDCTAASNWACTGLVVSTVKQGLEGKSGTSMAAPHVAAVAAELKSIDSSLTPAQIAKYIRGTATAVADDCPTGVCGSGIVNAGKAVAALKSQTTVSVQSATYPTVKFTGSPSLPTSARVGVYLQPSVKSSYSSITYQWLRDGTNIPRATNAYYKLTGSDAKANISVKATAIGAASVTSSATKVLTGYLSLLTKPTISGKTKVGKTLKTTTGTWSASVSPTKYQWLRGGTSIKKATKANYKLTKADKGKLISVRVTVSSTGYFSNNATSAKTKRITG